MGNRRTDLSDTFLFQLRAVKLPEPTPEYRFSLTADGKKPGTRIYLRQWRFDLAWPLKHLAVELEGGTWVRGRHSRGKGLRGDCEKYNSALLLGWRVLRFDTDMVSDGTGLKFLEAALGVRPVGDLF